MASPSSRISRFIAISLTLTLGALVGIASATQKGKVATAEPINYLRDVRPILARCFACHGADEGKRQANLHVDVPNRAVVGKNMASSLLQRIRATDATQMPPKEAGHPLTEIEKGTLIRWIAEGGTYAKHWAFVAPKASEKSIDELILARLRKANLAFSPEADRYTLIRRVSLDLVGLPPTPEEVKAFVADKSPQAYENLVDNRLVSPHFGERWARPWLDLARFADSSGLGSDPLRPNLWPYRDWVIRALNENKPYDQFLLEQIAGDMLPNPTKDQKIATAFHRNTQTNTEGGTDDEEFRVAAIKDRLTVTVQGTMGLTVGCAQCHSHKFDPISQKEYYQLFAFLNQTADNDQPDERPTLAVKTASGASVPLPIAEELPAGKQRVTKMLTLGNFLLPQGAVSPQTPAAFFPLPTDAPKNRLGLAQWIIDKNNPLTYRVAVNRMWSQLFGVGLVETEEDFGTQGALPSHPELLDTLAVDFQRDGNVKRALKAIVMSRTYRQSSNVTPNNLTRDPKTRLLSRYPRRRLEAEAVRDQALALSGLLSEKMGGPSVFPPQPGGLWQAAFNGERSYPTSTGEDRYRRGLYTFWRRTVPPPGMATFDAPSREFCTFRRLPTNTPLQALVTLNDPTYLEMARALGVRMQSEGGKTDASQLRHGLEVALCRPATTTQIAALQKLLDAEREYYKNHPEEAQKLLGQSKPSPRSTERAAWTVVGNVLLNLDGVLTKG
jgi:hypothetical protein